MRRLATLCFVAAAASCGDDATPDPTRYLRDPSWRRSELVASLTTHDNDYARLRLARYDTGAPDDWSRLPVWNPPASPVGRGTPAVPLELPATSDLAALRSLGERAFFRYPAMLASPAVEAALREPGATARYGFWVAADETLGGLVRVALADGGTGLAYSCATCHASVRDGVLVAGLANANLDLGAWGPGRVDVTTSDGSEALATPDLRAVGEQAFLQRAGAVRRRSVVSLAIRVETLLITSHHEVVRPPREVALGLALFLDGLTETLPRGASTEAAGEAVFMARCASCHAPPTLGGGLVAAEVVGTDPTLARTATRGTGSYRVPSLRGVGARGWLLHDGAVRGLDGLFDRARLSDGYAGPRGVGAVRGHAFGLDLSAAERDASLRHLRAL